MNDYVVMTDSGSDLDQEFLELNGVKTLDLSCTLEGGGSWVEDFQSLEFYDEMRCGTVFRTAAVTVGEFEYAFKDCFEKGLDVLYLGVSSGLSGTVNSAEVALSSLDYKYPDRKAVIVDSLCASAGLALLVSLCVSEKKKGHSLEEVEGFAKEVSKEICHWFTVDDLVYLKRGGRLNSAAAGAGAILRIKPIMHMDDAGTLKLVSVVQGRKKAIRFLAEKAIREKKPGSPVFISHADCQKDVDVLISLLKEGGIEVSKVCNIGPAIGAHSGPGTLALFYRGMSGR